MDEETITDDAIAIVGMSCRFAPDLDTPEKFWDFLQRGGTAVREMPEKRWRPYAAASPQATAALRRTTLRGSYLDDIEGFDAEFFGITPKEASYLDPQQRFMLELTWEALTDAGIPPLDLAGTDTGVYAAVNSTDYGRRLLEDMSRTGPYAVNGTTDYGIANRVSYFLDLHGPSMAVNTACAASLTAVHVAAHALRAREVPLAIVGGLNIISTPALNVALEGAGALAPDGRSKAYDADADGYGRGEGAGVVVLKRYGDALAAGDRVLALIRGSGVFQDGRSDGMMAPNAAAQEHMLRTVYARAGVDPATVGYIEAHGTGTPTGDGTELRALERVFGTGRPQHDPCLIGSVKPNVGHVEGGSGIVGVVKVVLAFRNDAIPPSVHARPTAALAESASGLRLVDSVTPWPARPGPRRAGVSNYGVGGTIAHVVLEEAPALHPARVQAAEPHPDAPVVVPVSNATAAGARALAGRLADWIDGHPDVPLSDITHTATRRRSHLAWRAAVVADSTTALRDGLRVVADALGSPDTLGPAHGITGRDPVWIFSGHGAQWPSMARDLIDADEAFTAELDSLAGVFREELGWTPRQALTERTEWSSAEVQGLTFATQVSLAAAWRARGVSPAAVIGHSVGEVAAAVAAGVLDVHQAARFACRRARALQAIAGRGAMVMASLSAKECVARLGARAGIQIAVAASPSSTVLAGDAAVVAQVTREWPEDGVQMLPVATDIAFHSHQVDAIVDEVRAAASVMGIGNASIPLYTTALADPRSSSPRDAEYWATNLAAPVRFEQVVTAALEDGHRTFLEVSTHPVVGHSVIETAIALGLGDEVVMVPSLRRDVPDRLALARSVGALFAAGCEIDWTTAAFDGGVLVGAPGTAWQHRDYWLFDDDAEVGLGAGHDPARHSLLGGRMTVSGSPTRHVWQTRLDMATRPYPLNHALVGVEVTPAASLLNSFFEAAATGASTTLVDIGLRTPLAVEPARVVQIVREGNALSIATRIAEGAATDTGEEWITHCTATIDTSASPPTGTIALADERAGLTPWPEDEVHEMFRRAGVGGYAFPWDLRELSRGESAQVAVMDLGADPSGPAPSWAHVIDAALTISAALVTPPDADSLWMSRSIDRVAVSGAPASRITVVSRRTPGVAVGSVDVTVADEAGRVISDVRGLTFSAVEHLGRTASPRDLVYDATWEPWGPAAPLDTAVGRAVTVVGAGPAADAVATGLRTNGARVEVVPPAPDGSSRLTRTHIADADAVLVVPAVDSASAPPAAACAGTWSVVSTIQHVLSLQADTVAPAHQRVWVVTEGVRAGSTPPALAQAPVWGAARIIAGEHPEVWGAVVDVESFTASATATLGALVASPPPDEDVVAVDANGQTSVLRLAGLDRPADKEPLVCSPGGTILITGGLGDLGLETARWLADRGARRVVLSGRRGLPPRSAWDSADLPSATRRQIDAVRALEAMGVAVHVLPVDVSDPIALRSALAADAFGLPPITGVIHAAGVVADDLVDNLGRDAIETVLGAKATGAWALHELFPPGSLDFFVLFSSCGQLARLSGQTAYAAGNSFLDGLAALRWAQGGRETVSIAWTSWRGQGLSRDLTTTMLEANTRGLEAVTTDEAFRAWGFADQFASPYHVVMRVLPPHPGLPRPPALRGLATATAPEATDASGVHEIDHGLPPSETRAAVKERVLREVAAELHADAQALDERRPLVEMGVDSVMAVALRVRLTRAFGLEFAPTILWAKPTVAELADDIHARLRPDGADHPPVVLDEDPVLATLT